MSEEKRKFPRADMVFNIEYNLDSSRGVTGLSHDLSAGGVALASNEKLESGSHINLEFTIDGLPGRIHAGGQVVRNWDADGQNFIAVQFTEIEEADQTVIDNFINEYLVSEV